MNETEMLALGEALARTADVLRPGEQVPFRAYVRRVLDAGDSAVPVTAGSRVVLYRRQGPMLDVLNRGVVRRICLN